jgi:ABC-2 type transport system permease protein
MMGRWLYNVVLLSGKELQSLLRDVTLIALIIFSFTAAVYAVATGVKAEVSNATVGFFDLDHSELSRRLRYAIRPPNFRPPLDITYDDIDRGLDQADYIFVVQIPPRFEVDVLADRTPAVQVLVDATAMTQASLGTTYLDEIFQTETLDFLRERGVESNFPVRTTARLLFNPNIESSWFTSVMQIVMNITVLSIVLVGAAVIRELEHGTIEHLLVMPVRASEIAMGKILTNGAVILAATLLSLWLVVHRWLGVPLTGSVAIFGLGAFLYLFSVTSLGILLATIAPTMQQFGLLVVPVYALAYILSGAATPVQSMPAALQAVVWMLPTTQFVSLTQAILYRDADLVAVMPPLTEIVVEGGLFLMFALARFRSMLARQG